MIHNFQDLHKIGIGIIPVSDFLQRNQQRK